MLKADSHVLRRQFLIIFLVYPGTSAIILKAFACESFDNGKRFLAADLSIDCDSLKHNYFWWYAFGMVWVYPVGVLVLYGYILFGTARNRKEIPKMKRLARQVSSSAMPRQLGTTTSAKERHALGPEKHKELTSSRSRLPSYVLALTNAYEADFYWW
jgi:hypothetical protein